MASSKDYDPELAGDTMTATKAKQRQTVFDQTNLPAQYQPPAAPLSAPAAAPSGAPALAGPGPVGRAAQQLPASPSTAPAQSLESLRPTSIGDGRSAIYAGVGANGEASFSNIPSSQNSLSTNFTAPNQPPDQRLSAIPGLPQSGGAAQQPGRQAPTSLADLSPGGRAPITAPQPQQPRALTDALPGYAGAAPQSSPMAQPQASLSDAWRGGPSAGPGFASLGSSANMGDGVGTFSQANQGDAALAMGRFQKAADLREGYKAKDQLQEAQAAQTRDRNFTVVRDSEAPLTRRELKFDQDRANTTQSLANAVTGGQSAINSQRQGVVADQQQRQASRLEDAFVIATAPGATNEQKQHYRSLSDPDNSKELGRNLTQAQIDEKNASAAKMRSEANPSGGPKLTEGQSKDLQYFGRGNAANLELASNGSALTGAVDSAIRAIPVIGQSSIGNALVSDKRQLAEQSGSEFVNALLRKDSGAALTPDEVENYGKTYLPKSGDGDAVLKQKQAARQRAIQGIRDGLGSAAILAAETNRPEYGSAATATAKAGSPAPTLRVKGHEDVQGLPSGTLFVGPDGKTRRIP